MADSTALDSFIAAQNFCTGSQTDYSTCIANNMRFTPFLDDTYEAAGLVSVSINNRDLPYLNGNVYTDLVPLAIANIFARIKMTNSYGGVSFRCSEVFNRPRLPLPKLQDLGIPAQDILNIVGVDPEEPTVEGLWFEGVPLSQDTTLLGYMFNYMNLLIGYTTAVSNTITIGKTIKGIILGSLNYYDLPALSVDMQTESDKSLLIHNEAISYMNLVYADGTADSLLKDQIDTIKEFLVQAEAYMAVIRLSIVNDVVTPLSVINEDTDFTTFDFGITDAVADAIIVMEQDQFPFVFSFGMQAKLISTIYGVPPVYPADNDLVSRNIVDKYAGTIRNTVSEALTTLGKLYSASTTVPAILDVLKGNEIFFNLIDSQAAFYITGPRATIVSEPKYQIVIDNLETLTGIFSYTYSGGNIITVVETLYDPEDLASLDLIHVQLDLYFEETGNASSIEMYNLSSSMTDLYTTDYDDRITEINLGGDFEDAGQFYYADIAYAVGYAKLNDIKSIQIDDEYYELTEAVDENGDPIGGISETGCTRFSFTRHVLPTYDVEVEMYVYPGVSDQPYCPTINRYHNFLTSKYSGMFTKMVEEEMGVFVFTGYKPMQGTVEEVIQLGTMDLNSINLNDPSLDEKSYETMLMKDIKNLTNSDSLDDGPITTEDLKYYLSSTLVDETVTSNYPGLAIIEFKNFPLGESAAFPKIKVNVVSEDLV